MSSIFSWMKIFVSSWSCLAELISSPSCCRSWPNSLSATPAGSPDGKNRSSSELVCEAANQSSLSTTGLLSEIVCMLSVSEWIATSQPRNSMRTIDLRSRIDCFRQIDPSEDQPPIYVSHHFKRFRQGVGKQRNYRWSISGSGVIR